MGTMNDKEIILKLIDDFLSQPNIDLLPASGVLNLLRMRLADPYSFLE